jgi:NitT/TauT family transport system substrate-binding protein
MSKWLGATVAVIAMLAVAGCGGSEGSAASSDGKKTISVAFSSAVPQIEKVPTLQALDRLKGEGYGVKSTWLQSSEDPVQAVVRGDAMFGSASTTAVFAAVAKGVPVKAVTSVLNPAYAIVARKDISGPEAMDGKRLAINAQVSSTAMYAKLMTKGLSNVKPKLLVIQGTPARISAMLAGQADAAVVQLSAIPLLEKQAPGKFHVIYNVGNQAPGLSDSVLFVTAKTLETDPDAVSTVVKAVLDQQSAAYSDTPALAEAIAANVPDAKEPALAKELADLYVDSDAWPKDGAFTSEDVDQTLERLSSANLVDPTPTADQCCDTTFVGN